MSAIALLLACFGAQAAPIPAIGKPIPFNTPEADEILSTLQVFPPDNPWNTAVDSWPVATNSQAMIAAIGAEKPLRYNPDMGFVMVPPNQPKVEVRLTSYAGESDPGPYPVPDNAVIEGWPADFRRGNAARRALTLEDVQRGRPDRNADRHGIVVDPVNRLLYEFYRLTRTDRGWTADQASIFYLGSNKQRPDGWTSSDAAGLPIFPAVVRYDELQRGRIGHALRVTFRNTRRAHVYPATHHASNRISVDLPRMGERFRLRRDFDASLFSPEVRTILAALKHYGMFNADNGIDWAISVAPDERIPVFHEELRKIKGSDFEVVVPPPGYAAPKSQAVYRTNRIEGWTVLVNERLLVDLGPATTNALDLLSIQLREIVRVVPGPAVAKLRQVRLWFSPEYPGVKPTAEYHPSAGWLREYGRDSAMAHGVEFTSIRNFAAETRRMPNFTLHELAHAYHHQVLPGGFDNPEIKAAFERARDSKSYDKVQRWFGNGRPSTVERAYAMTSPQEYFAESTEAFFSRNDFFPFTRKELQQHDPGMFAVLCSLWGDRPLAQDRR